MVGSTENAKNIVDFFMNYISIHRRVSTLFWSHQYELTDIISSQCGIYLTVRMAFYLLLVEKNRTFLIFITRTLIIAKLFGFLLVSFQVTK